MIYLTQRLDRLSPVVLAYLIEIAPRGRLFAKRCAAAALGDPVPMMVVIALHRDSAAEFRGIVGWAGAELEGPVVVVGVCVAPEFRRRGLGAELVQRVTEVARVAWPSKIRTLRASVTPKNRAARRTFEKAWGLR